MFPVAVPVLVPQVQKKAQKPVANPGVPKGTKSRSTIFICSIFVSVKIWIFHFGMYPSKCHVSWPSRPNFWETPKSLIPSINQEIAKNYFADQNMDEYIHF